MRITIDEISADGGIVHFIHDGGRADGVWRGDHAPQTGSVEVDLAIPGSFWWEQDIRIVPAGGGVIDLRDATQPLVGLVESAAGDGVIKLRIGQDLVPVGTIGDQPRDLIGRTVSLIGPLIEVTPR
jgi:hypothetical protein